MYILYQQILKEHQRLEEQIDYLTSQLSHYPDGTLFCTRNGNYTKWYQHSNSEAIYIPKQNKILAEQLAKKKYLSLKLDALYHEKKLLASYLKHHVPFSEQKDIQLLNNPNYQELLSPHFTPIDKELASWQHASFESNPKHPEQLIIKTCSGFYVRSKSEALIDMALCTHQIPHRYECALEIGDTILYPDFTIRHPRTGDTYYWEHFGLMDDSLYCQKTAKKIEFYTLNHIIPSIHLITTYETKEHPLSPRLVEQTIQQYFA